MLRVFDRLSTELSFHYEIDSGTLLGAVKLNNFIPWDLDGDLFMSSHAIFEYFQGGQLGTKSLQKEGISGIVFLQFRYKKTLPYFYRYFIRPIKGN